MTRQTRVELFSFLAALIAACGLGIALAAADVQAQGFYPLGSYSNSCRNCSLSGNTFTCECSYKGKFTRTSIDTSRCKPGTYWNDKGTLKCWALELPHGSYLNSCRNCGLNGNTLTCECSWKGNFSSTSIDKSKCLDGTLWNDKGKLKCQSADLPYGSYLNSCRSCSVSGNTLTCECSWKGNFSSTSIDKSNCENNSIWNERGSLKCIAKNLPPGSYKQSCFDCTVSGGTLTCNCRHPVLVQKRSSLSYRNCPGGIMSVKGTLMCDGSFIQTCSDCTVYDSGALFCRSCRTGKSFPAALQDVHLDRATTCYQGVSNCRGMLYCGRCP